MRHWLFKSEPDTYAWDDLVREGRTGWSGVRNYQARNAMTEMKLDDVGFFYHSSIAEPAVVGICRVVATAHPDPTQFERGGEYYDGRAKADKPIWLMVDVAPVEALAHPVTLKRMRAEPRLVGMALLRRGQRLSVQSVTPQEWRIVLELAATVPALR